MKVECGTFAAYVTWLQHQPESVRHLATEFGIGASYEFRGTVLYLVGHREDDVLMMSPHDPQQDAKRAISDRVYVSAQLLRAARS